MRGVICIATLCCLAAGCSSITAHQVVSTIFDGVPSLPPVDQLCRDYHQQQLALERQQQKGEIAAASMPKVWTHRPYEEKRCDDCHDKTKEAGLVKPARELCLTCHEGFSAQSHVHGPVAVGECLACHLPHKGVYPALLKADKSGICSTCHQEKRLSPGMHGKVAAKGMLCADCHDPHAGSAAYFIR